MTDTTPDYAELIERLEDPFRNEHTAYDPDKDDAVNAIRTLLERNAELERKFTVEWTLHREALNRAEAAEARVKELEAAIKVKGGSEHAPTQDAYVTLRVEHGKTASPSMSILCGAWRK